MKYKYTVLLSYYGMHFKTWFQTMNVVVLSFGGVLLRYGIKNYTETTYVAPNPPVGWMVAVAFGVIGCVILSQLFLYVLLLLLMSSKRKSQPVLAAVILIVGLSMTFIGLYFAYEHPYKLPSCQCPANYYGAACLKCLCSDHGTCDDGTRGTGQCVCDPGWDGETCSKCNERFKGEECDQCQLGYRGNECDRCAKAYTGEKCDECSYGWRHWTNTSTFFPTTTNEYNRHICDECMPYFWGEECKPCPYGNDVPHKHIDVKFQVGSRAMVHGKSGTITQINGPFDIFSNEVLEENTVHIKLDHNLDLGAIEEYITFKELTGIQCNGRGICRDDIWQQQNNQDWNERCTTPNTGRKQCSTHSDCTVSGNCKGVCLGTEFPVPLVWYMFGRGKTCSSDSDCINVDLKEGDNSYYKGGACVDKQCCDESYHGDGQCSCSTENALEPNCDYCPGYDWEAKSTLQVCSGQQNGQCIREYDFNNDYVKLSCFCATTPDGEGQWRGGRCECLDADGDSDCDDCAAGYFGTDCKPCDGGGLLEACSKRGICNDGIDGNGECQCYEGWQKVHLPEVPGPTKNTCAECAPNYFSELCIKCPGFTAVGAAIAAELMEHPQPTTTFHTGPGHDVNNTLCQSTKDPLCSLACDKGGWCDWGRKGTGTCQCWDNTINYNIMDNVILPGENNSKEKNGTGYCAVSQLPCETDQNCSPAGICTHARQINYGPTWWGSCELRY